MSEQAGSATRPVAVMMLPFALATWLVDRVDGPVGTLALGWTVLLVAGTGIGAVLQDLEAPPPRPRVTGVVVAAVAGWLTLTWYVVGWGAGHQVGLVSGALGSLLAAQVGGALGCWLAAPARRPRAWTPVVALATVPALVLWLAWSQGDRPEIEAMTDDLEATGVPPYLVEVDGYDLTEVRPGSANLYDGAGIISSLRPRGDASTSVLTVVMASSDTVLCPTTPECLDHYETVRLVDAVALVRRPDSPDQPADQPSDGLSGEFSGDLDEVLADIGDAELVSYADLAQLHPPGYGDD